MSLSPLDGALYADLLSDAELVARFDDAAQIRAMLEVEAALALAEAKAGVIPDAAAKHIAKVARKLEIDPAALAAGTAKDGIPVPALVEELRRAVGEDSAPYVHWGATSQDIIDTGLVLRLRAALDIQASRLDALIAALADQAEAHRGTVMAARTRAQQATPTTFGLKIAAWLAPLIRHRKRLGEIRPRLLTVQFGGASGTLAALGDKGVRVMEALAAELDLAVPPLPWHTQRDGLAELAGWLSMVSASLGKIGGDLVLLAQSEVGEVRAGQAGGSSTMPQKANPVGAETLVALARFNAGLLAAVHQAVPQAQERDGVGWTLEWLTLPQMAVATGAALRNARTLIESLEVDAARMRGNLEAGNGLILAEAASFALAAHMPRPEAQALVKAACAEAAASGRHLMDVLEARTDAPVDWQALRDPAAYLGDADALIDRVLKRAGRN